MLSHLALLPNLDTIEKAAQLILELADSHGAPNRGCSYSLRSTVTRQLHLGLRVGQDYLCRHVST